jgi:photoactive yellow protein
MLAKTGTGVMPLENPDFDAPNLASIIERLPHEVVNSLPFGAIRLDPQGNVVFYSESERRLSGYNKDTITHSFFTEIAPCMDNANFRGRIDTALQAGKLNITFSISGILTIPPKNSTFACSLPQVAGAGFLSGVVELNETSRDLPGQYGPVARTFRVDA